MQTVPAYPVQPLNTLERMKRTQMSWSRRGGCATTTGLVDSALTNSEGGFGLDGLEQTVVKADPSHRR